MNFLKNSLLKKPQQAQVEIPPLSEQMLITEIDAESSNNIVEIFNNINSFSLKQETFENESIDSSINSIMEGTRRALFGQLQVQAKNLDEFNFSLLGLSKNLRSSERDLKGAPSKDVPTPFMKRYAKHVERQFVEIDETIKSVGASFSRNDSVGDEPLERTIAVSLKKEHESIIRLSSKLQKINSELDAITNEFDKEFRVKEKKKAITDKSIEEGQFRFDTAETVQSQYNAFVNERKKQLESRMGKMDLFGALPRAVEAAKPKFGLNTTGGVKPIVNTPGSDKPRSNAPAPQTK